MRADSSLVGLVVVLRDRLGRRVLCPMVIVIDLEVLRWISVRVSVYKTQWMGSGCVEVLIKLKEPLDAMVFKGEGVDEGVL